MYSLYSFLIYDTILIYGGVLSISVKKYKEKRTTTMFQEVTLVPDARVGLDVFQEIFTGLNLWRTASESRVTLLNFCLSASRAVFHKYRTTVDINTR